MPIRVRSPSTQSKLGVKLKIINDIKHKIRKWRGWIKKRSSSITNGNDWQKTYDDETNNLIVLLLRGVVLFILLKKVSKK